MAEDKNQHPQQQKQNGQRDRAGHDQPLRARFGWARLCSTIHRQGKSIILASPLDLWRRRAG